MDRKNVFEASPWKAIMSLGIPALICIVVMLLYNMTDMYFISFSGDLNQVAAVSLAGPVFNLMMALSTMIGNGGCTRTAQALGKGDREALRRIGSLCFWSSMVFGVIFAGICFAFAEPLLKLLGASNETWDFTREYVLIMVAGAPVVLVNHSLSSMLRGQGFVKLGLIASLISTLTNIVLDPIFILLMDMGVSGAAVATVLGNGASLLYVWLYWRKDREKCVLEFRLSYARDVRELSRILILGLPNAVSSLLNSVTGTFSNRMLIGYGASTVAAMSAAGKGPMVAIMVQMGLCMGVQPLLAYCYGQKNMRKLKVILKDMVILLVIVGIVMTVGLWLCRANVVGMFIREAEMAALSVKMMDFQLIMCPLLGLYFLGGNLLQSTDNPTGAAVSTLLRSVLLVPMMALMGSVFGLMGLVISHTAADAAALCITAAIAAMHMRKIMK